MEYDSEPLSREAVAAWPGAYSAMAYSGSDFGRFTLYRSSYIIGWLLRRHFGGLSLEVNGRHDCRRPFHITISIERGSSRHTFTEALYRAGASVSLITSCRGRHAAPDYC